MGAFLVGAFLVGFLVGFGATLRAAALGVACIAKGMLVSGTNCVTHQHANSMATTSDLQGVRPSQVP